MLADLLNEEHDGKLNEYWEQERTANALTGVAVRLHATGCSLRETESILASLGVERSHQAIFQWVHRLTDSSPDPPTFGRAKLSRSPSEILDF